VGWKAHAAEAERRCFPVQISKRAVFHVCHSSLVFCLRAVIIDGNWLGVKSGYGDPFLKACSKLLEISGMDC
jgi:hypothetical protein